ISVVIPALDAADELPGALAALAGSELVDEIVVSDGGSRDGTVAIAEAAGARVVAGPCGRGPQLIAGAAAAKGEWLLFLHADRRLGRRRLAPIAAQSIASARRYRRDGYVRRPLRNLLCLTLYFAGVSPARIGRLYG